FRPGRNPIARRSNHDSRRLRYRRFSLRLLGVGRPQGSPPVLRSPFTVTRLSCPPLNRAGYSPRPSYSHFRIGSRRGPPFPPPPLARPLPGVGAGPANRGTRGAG